MTTAALAPAVLRVLPAALYVLFSTLATTGAISEGWNIARAVGLGLFLGAAFAFGGRGPKQ
jgi:hypothetical protein